MTSVSDPAAATWSSIKSNIDKEWDSTIVPTLSEYIKVPNQSPDYDPEWKTNGLLMKAFNILLNWLKQQKLTYKTMEVVDDPNRTPFLIVEIDPSPGDTSGKTCLMYGHMDKQPPLLPWAEGLGPYEPVIRDGKLYGRGGADDGFALLMATTSVVQLQTHGIPHGRIVIIIEGGEESSSPDLPYYIDRFRERIGDVDLVVCLDSGAANYEQIWLTTSLRGVIGGLLSVETLAEGMHSGIAGGVVPDTFRITRLLLDRLEDSATGEIKLEELKCQVPEQTRQELSALEAMPFLDNFALLPGVKPETHHGSSITDLAVRNFWQPCLTITGADLPAPQTAGNCIRTKTTTKVSVRLPPIIDAEKATELLKKTLERDPPFGAKVSFHPEEPGAGWAAPPVAPWLAAALNTGSNEYFGKPYGGVGLGGSIPLMGTLGQMFPKAQFVVTGVLGPNSNAHGPNEFLHIPFAKGINYCTSRVLAAHFLNHIKK